MEAVSFTELGLEGQGIVVTILGWGHIQEILLTQ